MGLFVMLGSLRQPEMLGITANIAVIWGFPPSPTSLFFFFYNITMHEQMFEA